MAFDVFNMTPPHDVTQSIRDELQDYLHVRSDWTVELVGEDGMVSTNGWTLILFSSVLYSALKEHWCKPYPAQVLLPDFSIKTIRHFVSFMNTGFVSANESELLNLTGVIEVLKLSTPNSQFTVMEMPAEKEVMINCRNTAFAFDPKLEEDSGDGKSVHDGTSSIEDDGENTNSHFIDDLNNSTLDKSLSINFPSKENDILDSDNQLLLKCTYCDKVFQFKRTLMKHSKSCVQRLQANLLKKMYTCEMCGYRSHKKYYLYLHQKSHSKESLICRVCDHKSETIIDKLNHICNVSSLKNTFSCEVCDKVYGEKCIMLVHMQQHSESKKLYCPICSKFFNAVLLLVNHVREHTKEIYAQEAIVLNYSAEIEPIAKRIMYKESLTCKICSGCFSTGMDKVQHDCNVKSDQHTFSCDICNKVYGEKCVMLVHKQQHSESSKTTCPICQKCIPPMLHLLRHVRRHTNETHENTSSIMVSKEIIPSHPFSAKLRGTYLTRLQNTKVLLSQKKKKYECPFCQKIFSCAETNAFHMRSFHSINLCQNAHTTKTYDLRNIYKRLGSEVTSTVHTVEKNSIKFRHKHEIKPSKRAYVHWCKVCKRKYIGRIQLLLHEQVHRGKSGHMCFICNRLLSNVANAVRHVKKVHQTWYMEHRNLKKNNAISSREIYGEQSKNEMKRSLSGFKKSKKLQYYNCKICTRTCATQVGILLHRQIHKGKSKSQCPFCDKLYSHENNTARHVKKAHLKLYCGICENLFTSESELLLHKHNKSKGKSNLKHPIINKKSVSKSAEYKIIDSNSYLTPSNPSSVPTEFKKVNSVYLDLQAKYKLKSQNLCRSHVCRICKKKFVLKVRLLLHNQWHKGKLERQCPYCNAILSNVQCAIKHIRMLHPKENNSRDVQCQKNCATKKIYYGKEFSVSTHNKPAIKVDAHVSEIPISDIAVQPTRYNGKKVPKAHNCSNCKIRFSSRARLLVHRQTHKGKSEHECPICNKYFSGIKSATLHVRQHISQYCTTCRQEFKTRQLLIKHTALHHKLKGISACKKINKSVVCGLCKEVFPSNTDYLHHRDKHKVKYKCLFCLQTFKKLHQLLLHTKNHLQRNSCSDLLECTICNSRTFKTSSSLIYHILKGHHHETDLICPFCSQKFKYGFQLRSHILHDIGETVYSRHKIQKSQECGT